MPFDIAIDFGDARITVAARGWKDAVSTPACLAIRKGQPVAMGEEAEAFLGRAPREISVEYPLRQGRVASEKWIGEWFKALYEQYAPTSRLRKSSVLFTLSRTGGDSMARSLKAAAQACDAQSVLAVDRAAAAWVGAGEDISDSRAGILAWLGEGYAAANLICRGVAQARSFAGGGLGEVDLAIVESVRREYALSIGPVTARELRSQLAAARAISGVTASAAGLDLITGFPVMREIPAQLGEDAARPVCDALCECVRRVAAQAAEESAADLSERPVLLMGEGASLPGLESRMTEKTGLACRIAPGGIGEGLMRFLSDEDLASLARPL